MGLSKNDAMKRTQMPIEEIADYFKDSEETNNRQNNGYLSTQNISLTDIEIEILSAKELTNTLTIEERQQLELSWDAYVKKDKKFADYLDLKNEKVVKIFHHVSEKAHILSKFKAYNKSWPSIYEIIYMPISEFVETCELSLDEYYQEHPDYKVDLAKLNKDEIDEIILAWRSAIKKEKDYHQHLTTNETRYAYKECEAKALLAYFCKIFTDKEWIPIYIYGQQTPSQIYSQMLETSKNRSRNY